MQASHVLVDLFLMRCQGFFSVFSGAEIRPFTQWNLGDFSPNIKKKSQFSIFFFFFFFFEDWDFHSVTTHTSYYHCILFLLQFDSKSMWNRLFVFLLTKNDINMYYEKIPNLGVYRANCPNVKALGPRLKIAKNPWMLPLVSLWRGRNMALRLPFVWQMCRHPA